MCTICLCSSCRNRRCWPEEGGYSGGSDDDEESHNRPRKTQHYPAKQVFANLIIHGDIEFKMDQNSYRMVPLSNCEDYMYRGGALGKAKPVSADATQGHSHVITKKTHTSKTLLQPIYPKKWFQNWLLARIYGLFHPSFTFVTQN